MLGIVIFALAGLLTSQTFWLALLPAVLYLAIHLVEGETITPMLLSRRFTLNPVLVVLSLIFWYWMWGALGAILAVPMLAVTKIICDRIQMLAAVAGGMNSSCFLLLGVEAVGRGITSGNRSSGRHFRPCSAD